MQIPLLPITERFRNGYHRKKSLHYMQLQLMEINKNLKTQKFSTGLYTFSTKNLLKKLKHKQS